MRRMSFALTKEQILSQIKTVTRRNGWAWLEPHTDIQPIEKGMGLKKGEKQKLLGQSIWVYKVTREPLNAITQEECVKEGFPEMTPEEFIAMYCKHNKCKPDHIVTRIEFDYLPF